VAGRAGTDFGHCLDGKEVVDAARKNLVIGTM
jgi:hypothetical protein